MRQPNPERGLFMDIQKNNLWTFMASLMDIFDEKKQRYLCRKKQKHFWLKKKTFMSKKRINDFPSKVAQFIFCWKKADLSLSEQISLSVLA